MTIKDLYEEYYGSPPEPFFFKPRTLSEAFTAGWQLERLQGYAVSKEKKDLIAELETMRLELMRVPTPSKRKRQGWVTIFPDIEQPGYKDGDHKLVIFPTLQEAQQEQARLIMESLRQFLNGERTYDEVDFCEGEDIRYARQDGSATYITATENPDSVYAYIHYHGSEELIPIGFPKNLQPIIELQKHNKS